MGIMHAAFSVALEEHRPLHDKSGRGNQFTQSGTSPPAGVKISPTGGHHYLELPEAARILGIEPSELHALTNATKETFAPARSWASGSFTLWAGDDPHHVLIHGGVSSRLLRLYANHLGLTPDELEGRIASEVAEYGRSRAAARMMRVVRQVNKKLGRAQIPLVRTMRIEGRKVLPIEEVLRLANVVIKARGKFTVDIQRVKTLGQITRKTTGDWGANGDHLQEFVRPQERQLLPRYADETVRNEALFKQLGCVLDTDELALYKARAAAVYIDELQYIRHTIGGFLAGKIKSSFRHHKTRVRPCQGDIELATVEIEEMVEQRIFLKLHTFEGRNGAAITSWLYPLIQGAVVDYIRRLNGAGAVNDPLRQNPIGVLDEGDTGDSDDGNEPAGWEPVAKFHEFDEHSATMRAFADFLKPKDRCVWDAALQLAAEAWQQRAEWERGRSTRRYVPPPEPKVKTVDLMKATGLARNTIKQRLREFRTALMVLGLAPEVGNRSARAQQIINASDWQYAVPGKASGAHAYPHVVDLWNGRNRSGPVRELDSAAWTPGERLRRRVYETRWWFKQLSKHGANALAILRQNDKILRGVPLERDQVRADKHPVMFSLYRTEVSTQRGHAISEAMDEELSFTPGEDRENAEEARPSETERLSGQDESGD